MKKITIVLGIMLILAGFVSPIVQAGNGPAPGRATDIDSETCKLCHTSYIYIHHSTEVGCIDCHFIPPVISECNLCHDVDHHEDASGRCLDCHENKQRRNRK